MIFSTRTLLILTAVLSVEVKRALCVGNTNETGKVNGTVYNVRVRSYILGAGDGSKNNSNNAKVFVNKGLLRVRAGIAGNGNNRTFLRLKMKNPGRTVRITPVLATESPEKWTQHTREFYEQAPDVNETKQSHTTQESWSSHIEKQDARTSHEIPHGSTSAGISTSEHDSIERRLWNPGNTLQLARDKMNNYYLKLLGRRVQTTYTTAPPAHSTTSQKARKDVRLDTHEYQHLESSSGEDMKLSQENKQYNILHSRNAHARRDQGTQTGTEKHPIVEQNHNKRDYKTRRDDTWNNKTESTRGAPYYLIRMNYSDTIKSKMVNDSEQMYRANKSKQHRGNPSTERTVEETQKTVTTPEDKASYGPLKPSSLIDIPETTESNHREYTPTPRPSAAGKQTPSSTNEENLNVITSDDTKKRPKSGKQLNITVDDGKNESGGKRKTVKMPIKHAAIQTTPRTTEQTEDIYNREKILQSMVEKYADFAYIDTLTNQESKSIAFPKEKQYENTSTVDEFWDSPTKSLFSEFEQLDKLLRSSDVKARRTYSSRSDGPDIHSWRNELERKTIKNKNNLEIPSDYAQLVKPLDMPARGDIQVVSYADSGFQPVRRYLTNKQMQIRKYYMSDGQKSGVNHLLAPREELDITRTQYPLGISLTKQVRPKTSLPSYVDVGFLWPEEPEHSRRKNNKETSGKSIFQNLISAAGFNTKWTSNARAQQK